MKISSTFHINIQLLLTLFLFMASGVNTREDISTITDIDGNIYKTVVIGRQEWMAENLRTIRFTDGTIIPGITDMTEWVRTDSPAYSWYDNDMANREFFGGLYNWHAVKTNKLCPTGWRVPSDNDWSLLSSFIDSNGGALKEVGTTHWVSPNTGATDLYGFTALPAGVRNDNGQFYLLGEETIFWSITEYSVYSAWTQKLRHDSSLFVRIHNGKNGGYSVRCIKD